MAMLFPSGYQFLNSNARAVASGTLTFYESGSATLKAIYSDIDLQTVAANPYSLDASGRIGVNLYGSGRYTVVCKTSAGAQVWSRDNVFGWLEANETGITAAELAAGLTEADLILTYPPGNVLRYGTNTTPGTTDMTAAFTAAIASADRVIVPTGTYLVDYLTIDRNIQMVGDGRENTLVKIQSFGTYDTVKYGVLCKGLDASALEALVKIDGIHFDIDSVEAGQVGMLITRKVFLDDVYVQNAPSDGINFRAISEGTESPYFCRLTNVWSKDNGRMGCRVTENCNANMFVNCQFDRNAEHGFHQTLIASVGITQAVYSNIINGGQASYNDYHGYYIHNGSNTQIYGAYAEFNSQTDGGNPKTGAYKNLQLGSTVTRVYAVLGDLGSSTDIEDMIGLNTVANNYVQVGGYIVTPIEQLTLGYENVGTGRTIKLEGGGGITEHKIVFREATSDIFRIRYDGAPASAENELLFEAYNGSAWIEVMTLTNNGRVAFFGGTTQAQQGAIAAPSGGATQDAESRTAIGSILTVLRNLGLIAT